MGRGPTEIARERGCPRRAARALLDRVVIAGRHPNPGKRPGGVDKGRLDRVGARETQEVTHRPCPSSRERDRWSGWKFVRLSPVAAPAQRLQVLLGGETTL